MCLYFYGIILFVFLLQNCETPLHAASKEGLLPVVQTMCAFGCRTDIINKEGATVLHLAARAGHTEIVRCLLLAGADPDASNKVGKAYSFTTERLESK